MNSWKSEGTASPFDIAVTELDFVIRWRAPIPLAFPALRLSRLLRARLWRTLCATGSESDSCAARAERTGAAPRCEARGTCLASMAWPFPARARAHDAPFVALCTLPTPGADSRLRMRLFGAAGRALRDPAIAGLEAVLQGNTAEIGAILIGECEIEDERQFHLSERAEELGNSSAWRISLLSPWIIAKSGQASQSMVDIPRFLREFGSVVAQRAYKLTAMDLADRGWAGHSVPDGEEAHAMCVRARDIARADLSCLEFEATHLRQDLRFEQSSTNCHAYVLHCLMGDISPVARKGSVSKAAGAWLAMLEALGGGEMSAEGYGAISVQPVMRLRT